MLGLWMEGVLAQSPLQAVPCQAVGCGGLEDSLTKDREAPH